MLIYRLQEADEALNDLSLIACEAYFYTGDVESGKRFLDSYNRVAENLCIFPSKFVNTGFTYRRYQIQIRSFKNYNIFFIADENAKCITVLRVLYQKQDWDNILNDEHMIYHINSSKL